MGDVNTNIRIDELETKIKDLEARMVTAQNIVDVIQITAKRSFHLIRRGITANSSMLIWASILTDRLKIYGSNMQAPITKT